MNLAPGVARLPFFLLLAAVATVVAGCPEQSDLGNTCRLMIPDGDGGLVLVPASSPPSVLNPNFDFVSTGDTDCENLICIRQVGSTAADANGNAEGICSAACVDGTDCAPSSNGLQCLQLSFDQTFLNNLQMTDPATFAEFFGNQSSATYCVQPAGQ